MIDLVLYRPEIPPNAGNVIRLAANTGARLHFVAPLGFSMDDLQLKRAGLDYHELANVRVHRDWEACKRKLESKRLFAISTKARTSVYEQKFRESDAFVFGPETAGLPESVLNEFSADHRLRLPMRPGNRSLNLSNAVAVVAYEAWRQLGFAGAG
jgi:tRNA (cytidine/uridine-2'-O-)-methyltransferase